MRDIASAPRRAGPIELPDPIAAAFSATAVATLRSSTIVWGEHCSECAFPACYTSCSHYTPRADMHCRRFGNGIEAGGTRPAGLMRIAFRRWGKLEGRGPVLLHGRRSGQALAFSARTAERAVRLPWQIGRAHV